MLTSKALSCNYLIKLTLHALLHSRAVFQLLHIIWNLVQLKYFLKVLFYSLSIFLYWCCWKVYLVYLWLKYHNKFKWLNSYFKDSNEGKATWAGMLMNLSVINNPNCFEGSERSFPIRPGSPLKDSSHFWDKNSPIFSIHDKLCRQWKND